MHRWDHQTAAFTIEFSLSRPRYLMLVLKFVHMCEVRTWHWDSGIELFLRVIGYIRIEAITGQCSRVIKDDSDSSARLEQE